MELPCYYELHQFSGSVVYHLAEERTLLLAIPEGLAYVNVNTNGWIFVLTLLKRSDRFESDKELEPA